MSFQPNSIENIILKGAREHNLKNVSLKIPHNKITVITGLSGSGKSSLAFDTLYAEGERRYLESLSTYARRFVEQLKKPDLDYIEGLAPAIAIDQKTLGGTDRSTLGTSTEISDYIRLMFARIGEVFCPTHHLPMGQNTEENIFKQSVGFCPRKKFYVLAPVARGKKGTFATDFARWRKLGFSKAKIDGKYRSIESLKGLKKTIAHNIDIVVDQVSSAASFRARTQSSIQYALKLSNGLVRFEEVSSNPRELFFSVHSSCPECGFSAPPLEPSSFSFNHPHGACPECAGIGHVESEEEAEGESGDAKLVWYELCPKCEGARLNPQALSVRIKNYNIHQLGELSLQELSALIRSWEFEGEKQEIFEKIKPPLLRRLDYIEQVGAAYLSLNRNTNSLSGGEAQRIRLATQVCTGLVGAMYVLDEPSRGLHPKDHHKLLNTLVNLKDMGNTVILVEHDRDTIQAADHIVDLGPGAGFKGGQVVAEGSYKDILKSKKSPTADFLRDAITKKPKGKRRKPTGWLKLTKAALYNLKDVQVDFPLGILAGVCGVSGSGKSTLVLDSLAPAILEKLGTPNEFAQALWSASESVPKVSGVSKNNLGALLQVDQKPIGRSPRSTPATYVDVFTPIRNLYASLPEARMRAFSSGHFSFNSAKGNCSVCAGAGSIKIEMHFLSDVYTRCESCQGSRYNSTMRSIKFKGKSIADVLDMTVDEAVDFFKNQRYIYKKIKLLQDVGLGYLSLGQSATTLSGGEAQRIKLTRELAKGRRGKVCLYILDEPTSGLHFHDIKNLVRLLNGLVEVGHSVLVIEHNSTLLEACDYIIELGPGGGKFGGQVIATGAPEVLANNSRSLMGPHLNV